MVEFTIYGIENEMFHNLCNRLEEAMRPIPVEYSIQKVIDIDQIVEAQIVSIPSLYCKGSLLAENRIPDEKQLRTSILKILDQENKFKLQ